MLESFGNEWRSFLSSFPSFTPHSEKHQRASIPADFVFWFTDFAEFRCGCTLTYYQSGQIILFSIFVESIESYCWLFLSVQPGLVLSQLAFEECFGQSARFATWDYTNSRDLDLTCEYSMQSFFCKFRFLVYILNFEQLSNTTRLILSPKFKVLSFEKESRGIFLE